MKRRYKLLLIIVIGAIATIIINSFSVTSQNNLVALGDGFSQGMTPYNVAGNSFNDYFKDRLEQKKEVIKFNNEFSQEHMRVHELNEYLEKNTLGKFSRTPIKQILAKADIITIAIGIDEMADKSLKENISIEQIDNYIKEMEVLLSRIREFYEKDIVVIGLYPAYNFTKKDAVEINSQISKVCGKYNVNFLDILAISLNEDYYLEKTSYYMNYLAHKKIADLIYSQYQN